jgi:hypothetical protein
LNWPNDIRFTKSDGTSLLDFWIESSDASTATIWIEFDAIPASPSTAIFYIYYGKAGAGSASNGNDTFLLFDDFDRADSGTVGNGWLATGSITCSIETNRLKGVSVTAGGNLCYHPYTFSGKTVTYASITGTSLTKDQLLLIEGSTTAKVMSVGQLGGYLGSGKEAWIDAAGWHDLGTTFAIDSPYIYGMMYDSGANTYSVYKDYVLKQSAQSVYNWGGGVVNSVDFYVYNTATTAYMDWIHVGKFATTEPTFSAWSGEQSDLPIVTTQAASNVLDSIATGNGTIVNVGVSNCDLRGVRWGTVSGVYTSTSTDSGSFGAGAFTKNMTGLVPWTTYYYQAIAHNSKGWGYGEEQSFTTPLPLVCENEASTCEEDSVTVIFSWSPVVQPTIDEIRSDCTLESVNYSLDIQGVAVRDVGTQIIYTWEGLGKGTDYQWRVIAEYDCTEPEDYGEVIMGYFSFTTPDCNSAPSAPSVPEQYLPSGATWFNCSFQDKSIPVFHWTYSDPDGDTMAGYELWLDSNAEFPDPKFNNLVATSGTSTAYTLELTDDEEDDWLSSLAWDTTYYWKVRVQDSEEAWSDWSETYSFQTPLHAYPWAGFSWAPEEPNQEEVVIFDPVQSGVNYLWTVTQGEGTYADSTGPTNENPHIIFSTPDNKIKLRVTDSVPYTCESEEIDLEANLPLPEYEEVSPVSWLKEFLASLPDFSDVFLARAR